MLGEEHHSVTEFSRVQCGECPEHAPDEVLHSYTQQDESSLLARLKLHG